MLLFHQLCKKANSTITKGYLKFWPTYICQRLFIQPKTSTFYYIAATTGTHITSYLVIRILKNNKLTGILLPRELSA